MTTATLANIPATAVSTWTAVNYTSVTVNWLANSNPTNVTQYVVNLSTVNGFATGTTLSSTTYNLNATFTSLSVATTYYAQVKTVNHSGLSTSFLTIGSTVTISSATTLTWTGATDTQWNVATNWDPNFVPRTNDNVIVTNAGFQPATLDSARTIKSLTLSGGGHVNLSNNDITISTYAVLGGTLTAQSTEQIYVGGNWDNTSGWFNAAQSTVNFNSASGTQYLISGGVADGHKFNSFYATGLVRFTNFNVAVAAI